MQVNTKLGHVVYNFSKCIKTWLLKACIEILQKKKALHDAQYFQQRMFITNAIRFVSKIVFFCRLGN